LFIHQISSLTPQIGNPTPRFDYIGIVELVILMMLKDCRAEKRNQEQKKQGEIIRDSGSTYCFTE